MINKLLPQFQWGAAVSKRTFVFTIAILSACTSPRQQCVDAAEAEYAGLLIAIETARANIARGYALETEVRSARTNFCIGTTFGGDNLFGGLSTCREPRVRTVERPVPIDIAAEQRKLESMSARLPAARAKRDATVSSCNARFTTR